MRPVLPARVLAALALGACAPGPGQPARITVDPTSSFQTITGWEATVGIDRDRLTPAARDSLVRVAVTELGISRLRLQAQGNVIESVEHGFDPPELAVARNDNDDPEVTDPAGFWWEIFDRNVRQYVLPIKQLVEARGERFVLNLCFVGFKPTTRFQQESPQEYTEFVLAVLHHLAGAYATPLEPDLWEVRLEPDNGQVVLSGRQVGELMRAAGDAARNAGFRRVRFSAPSTMDPNLALTYLEEILEVPGAAPYLAEVSYHRYRRPRTGVLGRLRSLAAAHGWETAMLEHIRGDRRELAEDLREADVSSWAQYTLVGPYGGDNGGHYFYSDSLAGTWRTGRRTAVLRQFFHFVRPGAVRIGATSDDPEVTPVAFHRPDSGMVAVLSVDAAGWAEIAGLREGRYAVSFTADDGRLGPTDTIRVDPAIPLPVRWRRAGALTLQQIR